jgi:hypothetical protein
LANDKFRAWKARGWDVGIATGDLTVRPEAPVLVATLETQRERFLAGEGPRLLVLDEYQMIADRRRGLNYELSLVLAPPTTQLLLLSGSVANPGDIASWLRSLGRDVDLVETRDRPVPLEDMPVRALPRAAPPSVTGFWPRVAFAVLLSDAAPLLVFAPRRKAAESIAAQIGAALPPAKPIPLSPAQEAALGPKLAKLVRQRVAFHHSGLTYAQRAGIIEPLAQAGQLRVIVATTGLAAGINFSVRSVLVAETKYQDGLLERELAPDELLQMYGRAGRRGLDEVGYALSVDSGPRLGDARPKVLRRVNRVDWPSLLRVMDAAAARGESPFEAAERLTERLYAPAGSAGIGFGGAGAAAGDDGFGEPATEGRNLFGIAPGHREIRNSAGAWEREAPGAEGVAPLREVRVWAGKRGWVPGLRAGAFLEDRVRSFGRLRKIGAGDGEEGDWRYAADFQVAGLDEAGKAVPTKRWKGLVPSAARTGRGVDPADLIPALGRAVASLGEGLVLRDVEIRDGRVHAVVDLAECPVRAYRDLSGVWLVDPERRAVRDRFASGFVDEASGEIREPAPGSAAAAWLRLGLIAPDGRPTLRGRIASFFHQGEGLAVAAALEDDTYPVEELAWHLANLRAGHRFDSEHGGAIPSERLGYACRQAYGAAEVPGYLRLGVPPAYGEGAAEVVEAFLEGKGLPPWSTELGRGDVERATIEWLSLLRHVAHAPDAPSTRWRELQAVSAGLAERLQPRQQSLRQLPEFEPHQLRAAVQHRLGAG